MSAYLNNPKFSELIDRVIYQYQPSENDEDSFDHISTIVQKINNIVFSLVINLAVEINKPQSEILQTFEMMNKLYNQFLNRIIQLQNDDSESPKSEVINLPDTQPDTQPTEQLEASQSASPATETEETAPMSDIDDLPSITA